MCIYLSLSVAFYTFRIFLTSQAGWYQIGRMKCLVDSVALFSARTTFAYLARLSRPIAAANAKEKFPKKIDFHSSPFSGLKHRNIETSIKIKHWNQTHRHFVYLVFSRLPTPTRLLAQFWIAALKTFSTISLFHHRGDLFHVLQLLSP